jgi:hypothetical protein
MAARISGFMSCFGKLAGESNLDCAVTNGFVRYPYTQPVLFPLCGMCNKVTSEVCPLLSNRHKDVYGALRWSSTRWNSRSSLFVSTVWLTGWASRCILSWRPEVAAPSGSRTPGELPVGIYYAQLIWIFERKSEEWVRYVLIDGYVQTT